MNNIDFKSAAQLGLSMIQQWLPDGKKEGNEWMCRNPKRNDQHLGSFKINLITGKWSDFATNDSGGDAVSLLAYLLNISQSKAAKIILRARNCISQNNLNKVEKPSPVPISEQMLAELNTLILWKEKRSKFIFKNKYYYPDKDNNLLFIIIRFENKDGKKECIPIYGGIDGKLHFGLPYKQDRPIYHLPEVNNKKYKKILIVEGEKAADAANSYFTKIEIEDTFATTWCGGANAISKTDFSPIDTRKIIILMPDADKPGIKAMHQIAQKLNTQILWINPRIEAKLGEDCADLDIQTFGNMLNNAKTYKKNNNDNGSVHKTISSAEDIYRKYQLNSIESTEEKSFALTDLGNIRRFVKQWHDDIKYIIEEKLWRYFDGKKWKEDPRKTQINSRIEKTVRSIYAEAERVPTEELRKSIAKHAMISESRSRRQSILLDAEQHFQFVDSIVEYDKDPMSLNVQNGTIDLRTGKLRPHNKDDKLLKISPIKYDERAKCPLFQKMLNIIFNGDVELINYVQNIVGYSMTGLTNEQILFFLFGDGKNGKSTFLSTISHILGDYSMSSSISTFLESNRMAGSASEDRARLQNVRMVIASETSENQKFDEAFLKDLTGGDTITARFLYGRSFDFCPKFKLWFFGNHKPKINGHDYGIRRRIKMIPFVYTIPESVRDKNILTKLYLEGSGILNWMLEGCLRWQREGFTEAKAVQEATSDYFNENDVVGRFLNECTRKTENNETKIRFSDLYHFFNEWPEAININRQKFSKLLKDKGLETFQGAQRVTYVKGIELN